MLKHNSLLEKHFAFLTKKHYRDESLLDNDIITKEEFEAKKKELLG